MALDERGRIINAYQDKCVNYTPNTDKPTPVQSVTLGVIFECRNRNTTPGKQDSCYFCVNHKTEKVLDEVPVLPSMKIEQFMITTSMGRVDQTLDFLSNEQLRELNHIGYSGEDFSSTKTDRETFLNSLGIGSFKVDQIEFDNGSFQERFLIARVTK